MGRITDRWRISFTLGPLGKEFGEITVRGSAPTEALKRFAEFVPGEVEITEMEKITDA